MAQSSDGTNWQIRLQGIRDTVKFVDVASSESEFKATTVLALKQKIKKQIDPELEPEHMRLLFAGKQLEEKQPRGGTCTLEFYKIKKLSMLSLVMRMPGGSLYRDSIVKPKDYDKIPNPYDHSLIFTDEQDCLDPFPPDPGAPRRIKMSCGHAVDATTLTGYCRTLVDSGEFEIRCPAKVNGKECGKVWEYTEVRKVAHLNDAECQWFESKLETAAVQQYCDMKECPGCRSFVERRDQNNLRVHCPCCTRTKGTTYDFCWNCLHEWTGPRTSSTKCGRPDCAHIDLSCIRDAPLMKINGFDVPNRRACPNCGKVVEHNGKGCKMMGCKRCKKEFCFLCLELSEVCLKTSPSNWYRQCKKPVAPRQTSIPVWRQ